VDLGKFYISSTDYIYKNILIDIIRAAAQFSIAASSTDHLSSTVINNVSLNFSESGKTTFVVNCLKYRESVFTSVFEKIYYFLPRSAFSNDKFMKTLREIVPDIIFCMGLPDQRHVQSAKNSPKVTYFSIFKLNYQLSFLSC
jgi:hypothetical protein